MRRHCLLFLFLWLSIESSLAGTQTAVLLSEHGTQDSAFQGVVRLLSKSQQLGQLASENSEAIESILDKIPALKQLANSETFLKDPSILISVFNSMVSANFGGQIADILRIARMINPAVDSLPECPNGSYAVNGTKLVCTCNAGFEPISSSGNSVCTACPTGKFNNVPGGSCLPCDSCGDKATLTQCSSTTNAVCSGCGADSFLSNNKCVKCRPPCLSGQYEVVACSLTTDRVCSACSAIQYKAPGASCPVCPACPAGQFQNSTCTTSRSSTCGVCQEGKFTTGSTSAISCQTCSTCPASRPQISACSTTADTVCTDCPAGRYSSASNTDCFLCTVCVAGTYPSQPCQQNANTVCSACDKGKFSAVGDTTCQTCADGFFNLNPGSTSCKACKICGPGSYVHKPCTPTSDAECKPCQLGMFSDTTNANSCTICPSGKFTLDSAAVSCTACDECAAGQNIKVACSASSNTVCGLCPAGTFSDGKSLVCTPCASGKYADSGASSVCKTCTSCEPGFYVQKACSASSNTQCLSCEVGKFSESPNSLSCTACRTRCGVAQYKVSDCSATQDMLCGGCGENTFTLAGSSTCSACKVCGPGKYILSPCTASSDTVCGDCASGTTYTDVAGSTSCKPCTICPEGSKVATACSLIADRVCAPCTGNTYSTTKNAAECSVCSDCNPGKYVKSGCDDRKTNRVCEACPANTFAKEKNMLTCTPVTPCTTGQTNGAYSPITGLACNDVNCAYGVRSDDKTSCNCVAGYEGGGAWTGQSYPACTACPAGKWSIAGGVCTSWKTCTSDSLPKRTPGSSTADATCSACPARMFFDKTLGECKRCTPCDEGEYLLSGCEGVLDSSCGRCDAGKYLSGISTCSPCKKCPPGHVSTTCNTVGNSGDTICQECPAGTYLKDDNTCQQCTVCEIGYFSAENCTSAHDRKCAPALCPFGKISSDRQSCACSDGSDNTWDSTKEAYLPTCSSPGKAPLIFMALGFATSIPAMLIGGYRFKTHRASMSKMHKGMVIFGILLGLISLILASIGSADAQDAKLSYSAGVLGLFGLLLVIGVVFSSPSATSASTPALPEVPETANALAITSTATTEIPVTEDPSKKQLVPPQSAPSFLSRIGSLFSSPPATPFTAEEVLQNRLDKFARLARHVEFQDHQVSKQTKDILPLKPSVADFIRNAFITQALKHCPSKELKQESAEWEFSKCPAPTKEVAPEGQQIETKQRMAVEISHLKCQNFYQLNREAVKKIQAQRCDFLKSAAEGPVRTPFFPKWSEPGFDNSKPKLSKMVLPTALLEPVSPWTGSAVMVDITPEVKEGDITFPNAKKTKEKTYKNLKQKQLESDLALLKLLESCPKTSKIFEDCTETCTNHNLPECFPICKAKCCAPGKKCVESLHRKDVLDQ